jgi:hypothetical protein
VSAGREILADKGATAPPYTERGASQLEAVRPIRGTFLGGSDDCLD